MGIIDVSGIVEGSSVLKSFKFWFDTIISVNSILWILPSFSPPALVLI